MAPTRERHAKGLACFTARAVVPSDMRATPAASARICAAATVGAIEDLGPATMFGYMSVSILSLRTAQ